MPRDISALTRYSRNMREWTERLEKLERDMALLPDKLLDDDEEQLGYCLYDLEEYDERVEEIIDEMEWIVRRYFK